MEEVSRNHFLNQDNMEQNGQIVSKFLQQVYENDPSNATEYFFYFGIDLQTTFQLPTFIWACQNFKTSP